MSELTEAQILDGGETSAPYEGTAAGQIQPPPVVKGADGPVLDHQPSREELRELASEYARQRELSGNAPQAPTQFQAPGIGEFKDAKSAIEKATEDRLEKIYLQERAKGLHPDQALANTRQYLNTEKAKVVTDNETDTFASPRAAAERLNQLRQVEAQEALKTRAAAAQFETRDYLVGKTPTK